MLAHPGKPPSGLCASNTARPVTMTTVVLCHAREAVRASLIHGAKGSADERASAVRTLDAVHPGEERLIEPLRFLERRKMPAPLKKDVGVPG